MVDCGPDADPPWMVTAYIPALFLDATVRESGPLDSAAVRALGAALAKGLAAIHWPTATAQGISGSPAAGVFKQATGLSPGGYRDAYGLRNGLGN